MMVRRMPRFAYWLAGAFIAIAGAVTARLVADHLAPSLRVPIWLTGCAVIFIGLCVVSLGTRQRMDGTKDDAADPEQPATVPAEANDPAAATTVTTASPIATNSPMATAATQGGAAASTQMAPSAATADKPQGQ